MKPLTPQTGEITKDVTKSGEIPQLSAEMEKRGLKAKIIGFTTFPDGQDKDCIAITDDGREITVDPFVGCSWDYDKREHLLNEWFIDPKAWQHEAYGVWLTGEHSFKLLGTSEALATALEEQRKEHQEEIELKDRTIENMMKEIRYLRGSQPERRKPRIRIKVGEDWHIPMITQAHDTPDGLFIEAELAILNGKE